MRVPHPWIENIDSRARTMLYRNFAEIEAALGGGFTTFTTVADDGTGDYTTIKAAVEAVPNDGAAFIYVKPHSAGGYYDDTVYGNVTLNRRVKIVVWAATDFNYRQRALSGTKIGTPPRERWDCLYHVRRERAIRRSRPVLPRARHTPFRQHGHVRQVHPHLRRRLVRDHRVEHGSRT